MRGRRFGVSLALSSFSLIAACWDAGNSSPGLIALTEAAGDLRLVEGRLCGDFAYGPFQADRQASTVTMRLDALLRAHRVLQQEYDQRPTPQALASLARYDLVWGQPERALPTLLQAVADASSDPCLLNDLSVAYLARFQSDDSPLDLVEAYSAVERAAQADAASPQVVFNQALIRQRLFLNAAAMQSWDSYLELDPRSQWAEEARRNLSELTAQNPSEIWEKERARLENAVFQGDQEAVRKIISRFPQFCREHVLWDVLPEWAHAEGDGNSKEAARLLETARSIGLALAEANGNRLPAIAVSAIDATASGEQLRDLAAGHIALREGRDLYSKPDIQAAQAKLERALTAFRQAGSPFRYWAEYYLALCRYQRNEYENLRLDWRRLRGSLEGSGHPVPLLRFLRLMGMVESVEGRWHESLAYHQKAYQLARDLGEPGEAADSAHRLGETLEQLGRPHEAWQYFYRVLEGALQSPDPRFTRLSYMGVAKSAEKLGANQLALALDDEAVRWAERSGHAQDQAGALTWRAGVRQKLGRHAEAREDLESARRQAAQIADAAVRRDYQANLDAIESRILLETDPESALQALDRTLQTYLQTSFQGALPGVYYQRALVHRALGRLDQAEADLGESIRCIEISRENVGSDELRLSYFESVRDVYDELVALQASRGDGEAAFETAEKGRARLLLDQLQRLPGNRPKHLSELKPFHPLSLQGIRQHLPEGLSIVEYATLPDRLLIWLIRREKWVLKQVEIPSSLLEKRAKSLIQAISTGSPVEKLCQPLSDLYRSLLLPIMPSLQEGETLVFVPERFLVNIPFSALRHPVTGRFLVEDHGNSLAPSSTVLCWLLEAGKERVLDNALFVGNPAFDRTLFPDLPSLPGAAMEVEEAAQLYDHAKVLIGEAARMDEVLSSIDGSSIVHVAAHALVDPIRPFESVLLLTPSKGGADRGMLRMHELFGRSFHRTRLVILSACGTAQGGSWASEGFLSFVQPFLSSGVSAVIASHWKVPDRPSVRMVTELHKRLRAGLSVSAALGAMQRSMIQQKESPSEWAVFSIIGHPGA